jgi:hypothetical protein
MNRLRIALAGAALGIPGLVFALNAFISYRERGLVEPYDIPAALAFLVAAVLTWRGLVAAVVAGAALCGIYLASAITGGPPAFIAYWIVALVLVLQAVPLLRR